jgi:hypothetical protein
MGGIRINDFRPGFRQAFTKPDRRPIYEWAHEFMMLPASYGIPGHFDVAINRPLIAVFDAIADPTVRRVRFRAPPRFGKSLVADIAIPWVLCNDPGPVMANFPKQEFAEQRMREKLWPLWFSCRPFRDLLPKTRFDRTNTEIYFGPFFFVAQGASPANLQGKGIRWQFNDEIWLQVWQTMYSQAVARTRDYARTQCEKIVDLSQAGHAGDVEDRNWREGHQAIWAYRSPADGRHYPLIASGKRADGIRTGLVWSDDAKRADGTWSRARAIETARYRCHETGYEWPDSPATIAEWNRDGCYLPQNKDAPKDIRSFSVPGLLNNTFADLVTRKIAALEQMSYGDMSGMADVHMQDESKPWEETYLTVTIDGVAHGYAVADYAKGELWEGERWRTLMADRQQGMRGDSPHRWCEIRAWKGDASSRQLYYGRVDTKEAMRELQIAYGIRDRCVWQDAGFERHEVFKEASEYGWIACFGSNQGSWLHLMPNPDRTKLPLKIHLPYSPWQRSTISGRVVNYLHFSEDYCADILANLSAGRGVGYEHPDDVVPAYLEQMKGEHKIMKNGRLTWEKITANKPNHAFDTGKMGVAFALLMHLLALPKRAEEAEAETAEASSS